MRVGVGFTPFETRADVILRVATRADELGLDRVGVAEGWTLSIRWFCWRRLPCRPRALALVRRSYRRGDGRRQPSLSARPAFSAAPEVDSRSASAPAARRWWR